MHMRTNFVSRIDVVLSQTMRFSVKALFDRDDSTTFNRVAPGIGSVNNLFPGDLVTGAFTQVSAARWSTRSRRASRTTTGASRSARAASTTADYTAFYRSEHRRSIRRGLEPFGAFGDPHLGRITAGRVPVLAGHALQRRRPRRIWRTYRPNGANGPLPRWNENFRYTFQDDLSWTKGPPQLQVRLLHRAQQQDRARLGELRRRLQLRPQRRQPAQHGQRLRQRPARHLHELHGTGQPHRPRTPALAVGRVCAGQLAHQPADDPRLRRPRDARRRVYEVRRHELGLRPGAVGSQAGANAVPAVLRTQGVAGNAACATANRRAINPITGEIVSQAYAGNTIPGTGSITNGMFTGGLPGRKDGWYYDMPASPGGRASGLRGMCSATARPRSAPRAGSSTTSSTRASTCTAVGR